MISVNLCCGQFLRVGKIIGKANVRVLILSMLLQLLPCYHDRHGGFGDQVIREGAKEDAFERRSTSGSKNHQCGLEAIDLIS